MLGQFKEALIELGNPENKGAKRRAASRMLGTFLSHGRFLFTPEELKEFLYPDVPGFLATHDCTIVTYGMRAFITAKVASALAGQPLADVVYTSRRKGRTIRRLAKDEQGPCIFVDDAHFQLVSVSKACPDVEVFEMRRDGNAGDGRWPVVRSLDELP